MIKLISIILVLLSAIYTSTTSANIHRIIFNANVVASTCHAIVDADGIGNNMLTFETYRKSNRTAVPPETFTIRLYESDSSLIGCSAFLSGKVASLQFGNEGQLDSKGVITNGAGGQVRIDVRAIDAQADYRNVVTNKKNEINYPAEFASKGQFRFEAKPIIPDDVRAGEYSGALSFVVTYN